MTIKRKEIRKVKMVSLDFLMYYNECMEEEEELMAEGRMEPCERCSVREISLRFARSLREK